MLYFGSLRGRVGYAPGNWLIYATGGFAWTYDQLMLTQLASGIPDSPLLRRLGWAAGAGVEFPAASNWTARFEYLFSDYGTSSMIFPAAAQRFDAGFSLQEFRAGLNYQFGQGNLGERVWISFSEPVHVNSYSRRSVGDVEQFRSRRDILGNPSL